MEHPLTQLFILDKTSCIKKALQPYLDKELDAATKDVDIAINTLLEKYVHKLYAKEERGIDIQLPLFPEITEEA